MMQALTGGTTGRQTLEAMNAQAVGWWPPTIAHTYQAITATSTGWPSACAWVFSSR
jgi:hypothetical protein